MKFNLDDLVLEYKNIEQELLNPEIFKDQKKLRDLGIKKKHLGPTIELYNKYLAEYDALNEAKEILETSSDEEYRDLAKLQLFESEENIGKLEEELKISLIPKDVNDEKNIIIELRARAGWDEASLFALELAQAYLNFAESLWFTVETTKERKNDTGWVSEMIFEVKWEWAYSKFKYESWVHRVQRIPETESRWRVHTSTITVAIMPEVDEFDVELRDEDLDIKATRSSGAGWQHVNKTSSAIHMTHIPTGISVFIQESRSQHKNKERAYQIIRSKLYALEEEKRAKESWEERLAQVGTWERSEKIRTYNYPQDRITDHRIWENFSNIPVVMSWDFWAIVDALAIADEKQKLANLSKIK